jgi:16S rRNA (adenine1518-N6/adenine1519-N6)-dimethyltransferase
VTIVHGDILAQRPDTLMGEAGYLVVANIPYYITSAVIRHLLESEYKPRRIVLTIQEEVARRVCAEPGDLSLLALSVQVYGQPKLAARIPAGAFYPPPKVNSAALRIDLYDEPRIPAPLLDSFFRLAKAGFSQKRKTLRNSLSAGMRWSTDHAATLLTQAGIDPQRRAQTLTLDEWGLLCEVADNVGTGLP